MDESAQCSLGACIAATTAFLVNNAQLAGVPRGSLIIWLAPTIIGTPAIAIWTAYYKRRFAARSVHDAQSTMLEAQEISIANI